MIRLAQWAGREPLDVRWWHLAAADESFRAAVVIVTLLHLIIQFLRSSLSSAIVRVVLRVERLLLALPRRRLARAALSAAAVLTPATLTPSALTPTAAAAAAAAA